MKAVHYIVELYDCPEELLRDPSVVVDVLRRSVQASGLTLLGELHHHFHPGGVTALCLLSESHLSIHTWPERAYAAADLFTCGEGATPREAVRMLVEGLRAARHEVYEVQRGRGA